MLREKIPLKIFNRLLESGFEETFYPDKVDQGMFLTKRIKALDMPYVKKHMISELGISDFSEVIIEITPLGGVQMEIPDGNYIEEPSDIFSDDGRALLDDAGVTIFEEEIPKCH
jgi:hypothetical protein